MEPTTTNSRTAKELTRIAALVFMDIRCDRFPEGITSCELFPIIDLDAFPDNPAALDCALSVTARRRTKSRFSSILPRTSRTEHNNQLTCPKLAFERCLMAW